jgi:phage terminase large subunit-like protein
LTPSELTTLEYDWRFWARDKQLPPPEPWRYWVILAGRGFGKTRTGAEWVREEARRYPMVNLIGATADDARDIMIEGESGILAICPPDERPEYRISKRRLEWPNGAWSLIFTADEPERLRGKQHMKLWADELASWRYQEAWDQAMFGLRLGDNPQACVTTTPKPMKILKDLLGRDDTVVARGSTYENRANLAAGFFTDIIRQYEGTRLGRQELLAEILDDVPGALWTRALLDDHRRGDLPDLKRVVIAIDPAVTATDDSDETGILVAGVDRAGEGYVFDDLSGRYSPDGWARRVSYAYHHREADRAVAEVNNGGDLVEATLRTVDKAISYKAVRATRGKYTRAEPIAALYEQGRVHHVGTFPELEDQMCTWVPGEKSPDRLDALVWALTELMLGPGTEASHTPLNPFFN